MKEVRIKRTMNKYGVRVKRCCASCQHKLINDEGERYCNLRDIVVGQMDKCRKWAINGLENAGKGGGDVRLKDTQEVAF